MPEAIYQASVALKLREIAGLVQTFKLLEIAREQEGRVAGSVAVIALTIVGAP